MTFTVTYDDGRVVEAVAKPKDIVAFERQYDRSFIEIDRFEGMYYLAWSALHRQGREPLAFDAFLDVLEECTEEKAAEEVAPFDPAPTVEPSPA